jgi:hypothetical protein
MNNKKKLPLSDCFERSLRPKYFSVSVFEIKNTGNVNAGSQAGFYKFCLLNNFRNNKADKPGPALLFVKPNSSICWNSPPVVQQGFACILQEDFLKDRHWPSSILQLLFCNDQSPIIYLLNREQKDFITFLFTRMLMEQNTDYFFMNDLMYNYTYLIIHEALKTQASFRIN